MQTKTFLLIIASMNLYAADTQLTPFKAYKVDAQDIAHDQGAFQLSYYPKENPFIIFGHKDTGNTHKTALKTALSIRQFVAGLLVLHAKSGNHKNLELVQNHFLDDFTDAQLLKGRVGTDEELGQLIYQQLEHFTQNHNIKLYEEIASDMSTDEGKEAFNYAKTLRQKDDFVRCRLSWISLFATGSPQRKEYRFGLPLKQHSKKWKVAGCQEFNKKYIMTAPTYGLAHDCKGEINTKEHQKHINANVLSLKLILAAHKHALDIQDSIKPSYAQSSFFMLDFENILDLLTNKKNESHRLLLEMEDLLVRKKQSEALSKIIEFKDFSMQRALAEGVSHVEWYKNIDAQDDATLTPDKLLVMLHEGTKDWNGFQ